MGAIQNNRRIYGAHFLHTFLGYFRHKLLAFRPIASSEYVLLAPLVNRPLRSTSSGIDTRSIAHTHTSIKHRENFFRTHQSR